MSDATKETPTTFPARLQEVCNLVGGQAELHRRSGVSLRSIGGYLRGENEPRDHQVDRLANGAGVRREWLRTGDGEMLEDAAHEEGGLYDVINPELMGKILKAVGELIPSPGADEQRASLVALTYDYMAARRTTDQAALAHFLRQWVKTMNAQPAVPDFHSPEVAGEHNDQGDLFRRRATDDRQGAASPRRRGGKPKVDK